MAYFDPNTPFAWNCVRNGINTSELKHISREKLQVGMVVVCGDDEYEAGSCWRHNGEVVPFIITRRSKQFDGGFSFERETLSGRLPPDECAGGCYCDSLDHLYLYESNNPTSMNIIEKLRNLTASKEEKLLVKYDIENPLGVPTEKGYEILREILYKENRDKIITLIGQLDEEENK